MAKPSVTTKFNKMSINVSVLRDRAKRNPQVMERMEAGYNQKVAPTIHELVNRHYENLHDNFKTIFRDGISGGSSPGATISYSTVSHSNMKATTTQTMTTEWDALSKVTVGIKGHDDYWKHTGALYQQVNQMPDVTTSISATGIDKRRSRVSKKDGKAPLAMRTNITFSKMPGIPDTLIRESFMGGFKLGSSGLFDMAVSNNILDEQNYYRDMNKDFAHMVLAETDRPFVQDLSHKLGQYLRTHLEARKLW